MRPKESNTETDLRELAAKHELTYKGSRYVSEELTKDSIVEKIKSML